MILQVFFVDCRMTVKAYICKRTIYASSHLLTMPKISEKTCLKSILCLFWVCYAFFGFFILGIGKPFKINNLQLLWVCCAHDSQNFEKGRGVRRLVLQVCWGIPFWNKKRQIHSKMEQANRKRHSGIVGIPIIIYILLIFIYYYYHLPSLTLPYFHLHFPCVSLRPNPMRFFSCNELQGLCTFPKKVTATISNNQKSLVNQ